MTDVITFFRNNPFLLGLAIGLLVTLVVWLKGLLSARKLKGELKKLRESLFTKMEIDAKGHKTREEEFEKIRRENENLRVTVKSLQQKPGRHEIRQLHVYDKAIHSMFARAPGFAATWEIVLKEAEEEIQKTETGLSAFVRKVFVPQKAISQDSAPSKMIEFEADEEKEES